MIIHFIKAFQMTVTLNMSLEVLILFGTTLKKEKVLVLL